MNIKCPYCKGVSESETMPEVGEALQCPYCSRAFLFGQEISKPTRVEVPMGLSGCRRSAAVAESNTSESTPVVRGKSARRSNFARRDSQVASEKKSNWLHDHLAIVLGIGGVIMAGLIVVVIALLLRDGNGRNEVAGGPIAVESMSEKVEAEAHIASGSPVVTNDVAQEGEVAKKDVVKVEQHKAVPMPPNSGPADKGADFSTPEEKDEGDDFASDDADDEEDPFGPDGADDDEDSFSSVVEKNSDGKKGAVAALSENDAQLDGPYFGLRWDQDIKKLPDELFRLNDKGQRESVDGEFRSVIYRPPYKHRWFLETMGKNDVCIALDDIGKIKNFICIHEREEKEGPDAKEYVARLSKMGEETLKEFRNLITFYHGSPGWRLDRKITDKMYRFRNEDEVFADVSLTVTKGFTLLSVCLSKNNYAGDGTRIIQSTKRTLENREEIKNEYATLKKDRAVLTGAISQLDMIPDPGRAVYSLSQILENYSLAKVYDKWSGKKWDEFSEKMLRKIEEADRRYQLPSPSFVVAETKLKAKKSNAEKVKEESEVEQAKDARKEAFVKIIASIKTQIEEAALKPLRVRLEVQEKSYNEVVEEEKQEAAEKMRMEEMAREAARKKMEPAYKKQKEWYRRQLDYNGLSESYFGIYMRSCGLAAYLTLCDARGDSLDINFEPVNDKGAVYIQWPPSMPKGFAQELIETRIAIYKFENPTWERDLKRQVEKEKRRAEEEMKEEKKKNAYKVYTPKKRKINPDLKRFKRNDRFSR